MTQSRLFMVLCLVWLSVNRSWRVNSLICTWCQESAAIQSHTFLVPWYRQREWGKERQRYHQNPINGTHWRINPKSLFAKWPAPSRVYFIVVVVVINVARNAVDWWSAPAIFLCSIPYLKCAPHSLLAIQCEINQNIKTSIVDKLFETIN